MKIRIVIAAAALFAAGCSPAGETKKESAEKARPNQAAVSIFDAFLTEGACFAKGYDAAHLAAHPRQIVTSFFVSDAGADWRNADTPERKHIAFGFWMRNDADPYSGVAACTRAAGPSQCYIEGDGGQFTMTAEGDQLRVEISRMEIEGPNRFSPNLHDSDDRIFVLPRGGAGDCLID